MKHKYYVECTVVDKYSNKYNINYVYYYQMAFTLGFASVNFNLSYALPEKCYAEKYPITG